MSGPVRRAFVPFSIEVGADCVAMEAELRNAFADAKDRLEATVFTLGLGDGSNQPEGLIGGLDHRRNLTRRRRH